jgi:hypothetical protein
MATHQDGTAGAAIANHYQIPSSGNEEGTPVVAGQGELENVSIPKSHNNRNVESEEGQDCVQDLNLEKLSESPLQTAGNRNNNRAHPTPISITRQPSATSKYSSSNSSSAVPFHSPDRLSGSNPSNVGSVRMKPTNIAVVKLNDSPHGGSPSAGMKSPISGHKKKASFEMMTATGAGSEPSPLKSTNPIDINSPSIVEEIPDSIRISSSPVSVASESFQSAHKRRQRSEREVLVGTPVKEGHVNYMLMYDMLTGIRISVSRCYAKPHREVEESDFQAAHKLAFDV